MKKELISVIMPCHNSETYIEESINSVLCQTYTNFELIIVNDKSRDLTSLMLKKYINHKQVRIFNLSRNVGVAKARNIGISQAKGNYIAFLDSDDVWNKQKLSIQINEMKKEQSLFSCTGAMIVDHNLQHLAYQGVPSNITKKILLKNNTIITSSVLADKNLKINFKNIKKAEDYLEWLLLSNKVKIIGINKNLLLLRKRRTALSFNKFKMLKYRIKCYKILKLKHKEIIFYTIIYMLTGIRKHFKVFGGLFSQNTLKFVHLALSDFNLFCPLSGLDNEIHHR